MTTNTKTSVNEVYEPVSVEEAYDQLTQLIEAGLICTESEFTLLVE